MSTIKTHIAQAIKIVGIMALIAAFAATAFPTRGFAADEANTGKLIISVYKQSSSPTVTEQPLAGASIEIINASGAVVSKAVTDSSGILRTELVKGVYKVSVSAKGYKSESGQATVNAGEATEIKFELAPANTARGR